MRGSIPISSGEIMQAEAERYKSSTAVSSDGMTEFAPWLGTSTTLPRASRPPGTDAVLVIENEMVCHAGATGKTRVAAQRPRASGVAWALASGSGPRISMANPAPTASRETASVTEAAQLPGGKPISGPATSGPGAPISIALPACWAGSATSQSRLRSQVISRIRARPRRRRSGWPDQVPPTSSRYPAAHRAACPAETRPGSHPAGASTLSAGRRKRLRQRRYSRSRG